MKLVFVNTAGETTAELDISPHADCQVFLETHKGRFLVAELLEGEPTGSALAIDEGRTGVCSTTQDGRSA